MKDKLNIIDRTFSHSKLGYCSDYQVSDLFSWDRTINDGDVVYTDMTLSSVKHNPKGKNYAWLIEPIDIAPQNYTMINHLHPQFDKVFTHEKTLLDMGYPYTFVPFGCCWIKKNDQKIYDKSKNLSIIASSKTQTGGHKLRHNVINTFRGKMDVYGRGWNEIPYKVDGLKNYRFSIVIENCKRDYWFTEKLIDSLVTGTVPVYWGCPSIGDFFDIRGFITFNTLDELCEILDTLSEKKYNEMLPYIRRNIVKAKEFLLPDDWVYNEIKKK
tara:strand:- start:8587 stop:9396 length:810 start_codon:yes stop_codon:yes gene_type:complete